MNIQGCEVAFAGYDVALLDATSTTGCEASLLGAKRTLRCEDALLGARSHYWMRGRIRS